jgi:glucokinase
LLIKSKPAKQTTIRNHNRNLVLQTIEKEGRVFRADLAKMTRISEPTISSIIEDFLQKGLVRELGLGESTSGRRPVMIEFNPSAGYVIGIDAGGTNIKIGVADLGGQFIFKKRYSSKNVGSGETAITGLANLVLQVIEESKVKPEQILSVGLSVPGIVDPEKGTVSFAPAFQWHNHPVLQILSEQLGLPISIENDVNAAALAEKQWGVAKNFHDFVFISIGTGLGAGLVLNDELHRGYLNAAGEIGYTIVDINWIRRKENPENLSFGCLESLAAALGVIKRARELGFIKGGRQKEDREDFSTEDIFYAAKQGDPVAVQVIDEMTDYLAAGIINIALIVSPQAVVLGGGVAEAGKALLEPLREKISISSPIKPLILLSSMHADAGLIGSASLAVRKAKQNMIEN